MYQLKVGSAVNGRNPKITYKVFFASLHKVEAEESSPGQLQQLHKHLTPWFLLPGPTSMTLNTQPPLMAQKPLHSRPAGRRLGREGCAVSP